MATQRNGWLASLCGLPLVGDWVATFVGLAPLAVLVVLGANLFVSAVAMVPWLLFLERWQGVAITTPYVPIKLVWLLYVAIPLLGLEMISG